MGIFYETRRVGPDLEATIRAEIRDALEVSDAEAASRAAQLSRIAGASAEFQPVRFLAALGILAAFVIGAVVADAAGLDDSSKALYGFATTTLGIIVGLLAGERSAGT